MSMPFSELNRNPRNKRVIELIRLALRNGRLPNSLLFIGPDGSGKKETAVALAKALNCLMGDGDFCGACGPCRAIASDLVSAAAGPAAGEPAQPRKPGTVEGRFPDVILIEPEKNNIAIEWIKFIREKAYFKPMAGRKRVFIIDQAEKMNPASSNALLKVYEEPPVDSVFILTTAEPGLLLPTIISRCMSFTFARPPRDEVESALRRAGCDEREAALLAPMLEFRLDRLRGFDPASFSAAREEAWKLFLAMAGHRGASRFLETFDSVKKDEVRRLAGFIEFFCFFGRDMLVLKLGAGADLLINTDLKDELGRLAAGLTVPEITAIIKASDELLVRLEGTGNKNLLAIGYFLGFGDERNVGNNMRSF